jgi:hypothetical protein
MKIGSNTAWFALIVPSVDDWAWWLARPLRVLNNGSPFSSELSKFLGMFKNTTLNPR